MYFAMKASLTTPPPTKKGIKPASLEKVHDPEVREFIEKCIAKASVRLPAKELLEDPFLQKEGDNESVSRALRPNSDYLEVVHSDDSLQFGGAGSNSSSPKDELPESGHDFMVEGQRKDVNTIFLKLRIADSSGHVRNIHFPFDIEVDTALSVASEMVAELDLTDQDVTTIAEMIDSEIQTHIPEWVSGNALEDNLGSTVAGSDNYESETKDELSPLANDSDPPSGSLVLERLPSGRKYWSDSPKALSRGSPARPSQSDFSSQRDESSSSSSVSSYQHSESPDNDVNEESNEVCVLLDSQLGEDQNGCEEQTMTRVSQLSENQIELGEQHPGEGSPPLGENRVLINNNQVDLRIISKKLEHLLVEQQKELDELRRRHEKATTDLLKELSPETRQRLYTKCHLKVPNYKMHGQAHWYSSHFTNSETSLLQLEALPTHVSKDDNLDISRRLPIENNLTQPKGITYTPGSSRVANIIKKIRRQDSISENGVFTPMFRDGSKSKLLKGDPKSAPSLGIAVILADDVEKLQL
ncbi:hypothetical protein IFM89_034613 [Coptis chinensis]|uniref:non-specific serine/threonine protein kinase n=1 Tax=Coptis chinensis TaxID=261450 RepID=A0A835LQ44_9MAGN|nr:hypothetical protein IFM89_034613 [Coptis chinensis]